MTPKLTERLEELKTEFESGRNMLNEIEAKRNSLKETLLRISGAIQVLEEQLNNEHDSQETLNFETPGPLELEEGGEIEKASA